MLEVFLFGWVGLWVRNLQSFVVCFWVVPGFFGCGFDLFVLHGLAVGFCVRFSGWSDVFVGLYFFAFLGLVCVVVVFRGVLLGSRDVVLVAAVRGFMWVPDVFEFCFECSVFSVGCFVWGALPDVFGLGFGFRWLYALYFFFVRRGFLLGVGC